MSEEISSLLTGPAVGTMLVLGGTIEAYEAGARRTAVAETPVEGMVLHWSAQTGQGTITGTLWRERDHAEHFLADVLADTFTEMVGGSNLNQHPRPDYSYEMATLKSFTAGESAENVVGRKLGDAAGAVLIRPTGDLAELDLSEGVPAGLIAHISMIDGDAVRWVDIWIDSTAPDGVYATTALEMLPLHTILVNADQLARLPEYPPRS